MTKLKHKNLRILLVRRGALGDILMTTPLIRQLRYTLPTANIDYCLAKPFASALKHNQHLNQLITLPEKNFTLFGLHKLIAFIYKIRLQYDYVFILGKDWRFIALWWFFMPKAVKVGYHRDALAKYLLNYSVSYDNVRRYHGLYYLDLLTVSKLAVANYTDISLDLTITSADRAFVDNICKQYRLVANKFIIITNSGGSNSYENSCVRMLPDDKIRQLVARIGNALPIVLLGGGGDIANYNRYINTDFFSSEGTGFLNCINLAGKLTVSQSAWLIKLAKCFYTTDCGAMHLAVAVNALDKTTCFFGPSCPYHVLPANKQTTVIWQDADIFDVNYPLYGKQSFKSCNKFFSKLFS